MPNAYISGTGFYVPPKVVSNDDLVKDYGIDTSHEWIVKRTGIENRRFAEAGVGSAEMALPASQMAIEAAGLQPKDIDMIIFATLSPRHHFPGDGVRLQQTLGLPAEGKFVPALDIRNQCSGFLYGLGTADSMVRSGVYKHVLVVGAECHSGGLDMSTRGRTVSTLFGDGAGAAIVSATDEDRGIRNWNLGADGRYADELCQKVFDTRARPYIEVDDDDIGRTPVDMMWPYMNGRLVFKNAVERMIMALWQATNDADITINDLDLLVFHQANMRINQYVQKQIGLPDEKVVHNIQNYGNTTAATIPILLAESVRNGRLKPGMKVACVAFGSGFTWGACVIDW